MLREWNGEKKNSNGAAAYVICRCVRLRISSMYNGIPPFSAARAAQYENAFFLSLTVRRTSDIGLSKNPENF